MEVGSGGPGRVGPHGRTARRLDWGRVPDGRRGPAAHAVLGVPPADGSMSTCCFGVEPRADGSIVVAAQAGGQIRVERFDGARGQVPAVVRFVRERSRSPRVCIGAIGAGALALALAFGELPEAEVILLRPTALAGTGPAAASAAGDGGTAVALARYARRAA